MAFARGGLAKRRARLPPCAFVRLRGNRTMLCAHAGARGDRCGHYQHSGHAKKLGPIISSLDHYDHNPEAWRELKHCVERMTLGWDALLGQAGEGSAAHSALTAQRDLCLEALRVQSDLFHNHRRTCVQALRLQIE